MQNILKTFITGAKAMMRRSAIAIREVAKTIKVGAAEMLRRRDIPDFMIFMTLLPLVPAAFVQPIFGLLSIPGAIGTAGLAYEEGHRKLARTNEVLQRMQFSI